MWLLNIDDIYIKAKFLEKFFKAKKKKIENFKKKNKKNR